MKEDYDGAEPAASSISVLNLLTLSHLMPSDDRRQKAERTLARLGAIAREDSDGDGVGANMISSERGA